LISYIHIYNTIKQKKLLKKIINSKDIYQEYKAQANLLDYTSEIKLEQFILQYQRLASIFNMYAYNLVNFYKNYLK